MKTLTHEIQPSFTTVFYDGLAPFIARAKNRYDTNKYFL